MDNQGIAELGRKIKAQYSTYANIPDEILGAKVAAKFPAMAPQNQVLQGYQIANQQQNLAQGEQSLAKGAIDIKTSQLAYDKALREQGPKAAFPGFGKIDVADPMDAGWEDTGTPIPTQTPQQQQNTQQAAAPFNWNSMRSNVGGQAPQGGQTPSQPSSKSLLGFIGNILKSGVSNAGGIASALIHPIDTATNLGKLAVGTGQLLVPGEQGLEDRPRAVGKFYKDRYGGVQNVIDTAYTDPVGTALDASVLLGGAGAVAKGIGGLSKSANLLKASEALSGASRFVDPLSQASKLATKALPIITTKGGKLLARGTDLVAGTDAGTIERAFTRPKQVASAMRGESTIMPIVQQSRTALESIEKSHKLSYGKEFDNIVKQTEGLQIPINSTRDSLLGVLNKYGSEVKPLAKNEKGIIGSVSFDRSSISNPSEISSLNGLVKDINTWDNFSVKGVNTLKQRIQNAFRPTASSKYNGIVTELSNSIDDLLSERVPALADINADYAIKQELIGSLRQKLDKTGAEGQLSNIFGKNKTEVRDLFQELEKMSGKDILESIKDIKAGQSLGNAFASTGSRTQDIFRALVSGSLGFAKGGILGSVAGLAATSPLVIGKVATGLGNLSNSLPKITTGMTSGAGQLSRTGLIASRLNPQGDYNAPQSPAGLPQPQTSVETQPPATKSEYTYDRNYNTQNTGSQVTPTPQATPTLPPITTIGGRTAEQWYNESVKAYNAGYSAEGAQAFKFAQEAQKLATSGGKDKPLSGTQKQALNNAQTGIRALNDITTKIYGKDYDPSKPKFASDNILLEAKNPLSQSGRQLKRDIVSLVDLIGYKRTGASYTKEQRADYMYLAPTWPDDAVTAQGKINNLLQELSDYKDLIMNTPELQNQQQEQIPITTQ